MDPKKWIESLPGTPSLTAAAKRSDIQKTTLIRQIDRGTIPSDNVIAIARAYGVNIVDALIATGHLEPTEVEIVGVAQALGHATNAEMLEEMRKRVDPEAVRLFHGGDGEVTPHFDDEGAEVFNFPGDTPEGDSGEQQEHNESTPNVHGEGQDLDEVLRRANQLKGAAQRRTPRIEEPEDP
ncbi:hypothetical protein [Corynebacterium glyciniphilum]|uniref:hypothetical protein n=1 Tax=Corynebacterium glyciniphilum TaxID=1404244 RepID=UPI0011AB5757|nr:hypothetical protein [Corynebacterium glyciniphilum]